MTLLPCDAEGSLLCCKVFVLCLLFGGRRIERMKSIWNSIKCSFKCNCYLLCVAANGRAVWWLTLIGMAELLQYCACLWFSSYSTQEMELNTEFNTLLALVPLESSSYNCCPFQHLLFSGLMLSSASTWLNGCLMRDATLQHHHYVSESQVVHTNLFLSDLRHTDTLYTSHSQAFSIQIGHVTHFISHTGWESKSMLASVWLFINLLINLCTWIVKLSPVLLPHFRGQRVIVQVWIFYLPSWIANMQWSNVEQYRNSCWHMLLITAPPRHRGNRTTLTVCSSPIQLRSSSTTLWLRRLSEVRYTLE